MLLKSATYSVLRLAAGLLTVALLLLQNFIPPKLYKVRPNVSFVSTLYGHQHGNQYSAAWLNEEKQHFTCEYYAEDPYSCGFIINFDSDPARGIDMSDYSGLQIKIKYVGDAPRFRIFLRDFNPRFDNVKEPNLSAKFMSVVIRTSDLAGPAFIKMSEFSVGEWWIRDFDVPRAHSAPEFNNVTALGIDFIFPGKNELVIESVELVGEWVKKETLYFSIIVIWMTLILWEGIFKVYKLYQESKRSSQHIDRLISDYKNLEIEKKNFEVLSTTDVLTGVMNRAGVQQFMAKLFDGDMGKNNIGLMLFDIDHFKQVNDLRGHDAGDRVLQGVAKLIAQTTRQTDVFGRWGGEEFILICPHLPVDRLIAFAEKVRITVNEFVFEQETKPLQISISIGATLAQGDESFDAILKRADLALYEAKNRGRNRVVFNEV